MIKAMSDVEHGELLQRAFDFELALVSSSRISGEDFSAVRREAKEVFKDIEGQMRPWLGRTKQDRQVRESQEFKEHWEAISGFNPDDKEALRNWEKSITEHTDAKRQERLDAEREELDRQGSFHARIEAVRKKRLEQQGRK